MSDAAVAVALLSGGLDSGVAAALWQDAGNRLAVALHVDYGQLAAGREALASQRLAERLQVPWQAIELPWLGELARRGGSALVTGAVRALPETDVEHPGDADTAAAVWVPARNVALIAAAAAVAETETADAVVVGFNREEAATFPDNSDRFLAAMTAALELGTRTGVVVASPTVDLDKRGLVRAARRLGFGPADFWSCYRADGDPATCRCESCVRSRRAWRGE